MSDSEIVRYVVAGTPNGWAAIAKTIRDVDEDKVKNCKEDIDTLLVFAGLFSAVLTAFLIASYPNLSPDKTDTVIELLSQISAQTSSYSIVMNSVNSSVQPFTVTSGSLPFEPYSSDIRINVLWFASLTISLMTASFGILVKQWLREYLSVDYTSPQARLRARQFRHPGLASWKVFEIAAFLPLLLQLALGLFFAGLCYFAWSIHSSIGRTSTPLVAIWGFLFLGATIAPAFSPRCPYKTALLKDVLKTFRTKTRTTHIARRIVRSFTRRRVGIVGTVGDLLRQFTLPSRPVVLEEDQAIRQDSDELEILKEVDALLLDDDLLGTTMLDSLKQQHATPYEIISFVLQALDNRLKRNLSATRVVSILDLRRLSKRAWMGISDIIASMVMQTIGKQGHGEELPSWVQEAMYLLTSSSDHPPTELTRDALVRCLEYTPARQCICNIIPSFLSERSNFVHFLDKLRTFYDRLTGNRFLWLIGHIVQETICTPECSHAQIDSLECLLGEHNQKDLPLGFFQHLHPFLTNWLQRVQNTETDSWPEGCYSCLGALLSWCTPQDPTYDDTVEILSLIFNDAQQVSAALCTLVSASPRHRIARGAHVAKTFVAICRHAGTQAILKHITEECLVYVAGTGIDESISMNPVRLLTLALAVYNALPQTSKDHELWREFSEASGDAMSHFRLERYRFCERVEQEDTALLARQCLLLMDKLDAKLADREVPFMVWCKNVDLEKSIFPDELYVQLTFYVSKRISTRFRRVNRIRAMEKLRDSQVIQDLEDNENEDLEYTLGSMTLLPVGQHAGHWLHRRARAVRSLSLSSHIRRPSAPMIILPDTSRSSTPQRSPSPPALYERHLTWSPALSYRPRVPVQSVISWSPSFERGRSPPPMNDHRSQSLSPRRPRQHTLREWDPPLSPTPPPSHPSTPMPIISNQPSSPLLLLLSPPPMSSSPPPLLPSVHPSSHPSSPPLDLYELP